MITSQSETFKRKGLLTTPKPDAFVSTLEGFDFQLGWLSFVSQKTNGGIAATMFSQTVGSNWR